MSDKHRPPEGRYAACANGLRMHYLDAGEGPVVVLLHGSGPGASGYSNFKGNYPAFVEQGYRCVVPDLVGFGYSDKPENVDHTLGFFVECLKQTLDAAGVQRCAVIGNSLGGAVAIGLALDYPDLVERLVLMAPGGMSEREEYLQMPGMQKMFEVYLSEEGVTPARMREMFESGLVYDRGHITEELVAERMHVMELMNGHVMVSMDIPYLPEKLSGLTCPLLAFWGTDDQMMPESGLLALAREGSNMKMIVLSECGHWAMVEHEKLFNRECLQFFQA